MLDTHAAGQLPQRLLDVLQAVVGAVLDVHHHPALRGPVVEHVGSGEGVQVSPQEMESIQRLEALGFQRVQCLEALRACDGNEEMAADFLFSTAMEDENQMMQSAVAQSSVGVNPSPAQPQPTLPLSLLFAVSSYLEVSYVYSGVTCNTYSRYIILLFSL